MSPPRGGRRILSAIEVVFASRSMLHLSRRSRVFIHFNALCTPCAVNDSWCYRSFFPRWCSTAFLDVARRCPRSFHRSSGTISSTARHFSSAVCRHRDIETAKQNNESYLLFVFPKSTLMVILRRSAPLSQLVFNNEGRLGTCACVGIFLPLTPPPSPWLRTCACVGVFLP